MISKLTMRRVAATLAVAAAAISTAAFARPVIVDVAVAPPAPRYEVVPAARPGYLWTPGYWSWRGNRHVWVGGNWVRERRGYVYAQPAWENRGGNWHFNRGGWGRGDRDHDGVPNRDDRHPDNPNRR